MKILKKTLGILILLAGMLLVALVFVNVPTKPITDIFAGKVTASEINAGYYRDYVGKFGDDTVPVLKASDIIGNENYDYDAEIVQTVYKVKTDEIIPLGYYGLKNSDYTTIGGNSYKNRNRVTHLAQYTETPSFLYKFLYAQYYLVKLDDGSYITAFMNSDYANSDTLPLADIEGLPGNFEDDFMELGEKNTDIPLEQINFEYTLTMQLDESDVGGSFLDLAVRIVISAVLAVVLLIGVGFLSKKAKLF